MSTVVNLKSVDLFSNTLFGEIILGSEVESKKKISTQNENINTLKNMMFRSGAIAFIFVTYTGSPVVTLPDHATLDRGSTNVGSNLFREYTNSPPSLNDFIIENRNIFKSIVDVSIYDLSTRQLTIINTDALTSIKDDTMEVSNPIEEDISMYDKLVNHRALVERQGMIVGAALCVVTLASSFLFKFIPWSASVPAALMFGSLSIFMLLRKKLRGDHDD